MKTHRIAAFSVLLLGFPGMTSAADAVPRDESRHAILNVPAQFATIRAAIGAAKTGDTVLVGPGIYRERLKLKPGLVLKSAGDDTKGELGLRRAEATILDGTGGEGPGVEMAAAAVLDGFTVTGVGKYDDALWRHHYATNGEEQSHDGIGQPGTPGIAANDDCTVTNNIVHHIGYTGIAIMGAPGRKVAPRVAGNICHRNMGGGIGSIGGSAGVIEHNVCFENFHAGIGHSGSSPVVRGNICYGNVRAGIGISEGASPTVIGNRCFKNRRAGIGVRTGESTRPVLEDNECFENEMAGIGVEDRAFAVLKGNVCRANNASGVGLRGGARAEIVNNRILDNALVAIGITEKSEAIITANELAREGGMPPMIAVLNESRAVVSKNTIRGGGVAGILVKGRAEIRDNRFVGNGAQTKSPSSNAVWAHPGSEVIFSGNHVERWRQALSANKSATIVVTGNEVSAFTGIPIVIKDTATPVEVTGNVFISDDPGGKTVDLSGPAGKVSGNEVKRPAR